MALMQDTLRRLDKGAGHPRIEDGLWVMEAGIVGTGHFTIEIDDRVRPY